MGYRFIPASPKQGAAPKQEPPAHRTRFIPIEIDFSSIELRILNQILQEQQRQHVAP